MIFHNTENQFRQLLQKFQAGIQHKNLVKTIKTWTNQLNVVFTSHSIDSNPFVLLYQLMMPNCLQQFRFPLVCSLFDIGPQLSSVETAVLFFHNVTRGGSTGGKGGRSPLPDGCCGVSIFCPAGCWPKNRDARPIKSRFYHQVSYSVLR